MPATVGETLALLELKDLGADNCLGGQPASTVLAKVFGGQVAAQLLASADRTVDDGRRVHSLHAHFYLPGNWESAINYAVDRVRDGSSFTSRQMTAVQGGQCIASATASYQKAEAGFEHRVEMPVVSAPEDSPELFAAAQGRSQIPADDWRKEFGAFEMRLADHGSRASDAAAGKGTGPGVQRIWMRFKGFITGDPRLESLVFTYISDFSLLAAALAPHGMLLGASDVQRATLSHSVWYHGQPRPSEWFLYDQESSWAGGGRGLATARVFTRAGQLVATTAQEGLIRPHGQQRKRLGL